MILLMFWQDDTLSEIKPISGDHLRLVVGDERG